jgi:hypothetical protein
MSRVRPYRADTVSPHCRSTQNEPRRPLIEILGSGGEAVVDWQADHPRTQI